MPHIFSELPDWSLSELSTPTNARVVPMKNGLAPKQLLGYEPFAAEGKLAYSD